MDMVASVLWNWSAVAALQSIHQVVDLIGKEAGLALGESLGAPAAP